MTSPVDGQSEPAKPSRVQRLGRRRVGTRAAPGVVPQVDPTYDDRAVGDELPPGCDPGQSGAGARPAGATTGQPQDARERWLLEQRPPHWG